MNTFRKAERKRSKLRLAICGPSGSGKTYSALLIASGLAPEGRIAMVDTERGSGELYSGLVTYDVAPITPPFAPRRYIELIRHAEELEYDVIIIDSLSHAWTGEGGVLDMHDQATAASRSGNSFAGWREVTPQHNALVDAIIGAGLHVIVTMRTKTAYEMTDDSGKKKPIKIGLAPVQRDGMEYEFTTVLDLSMDGHVATASKDRTGLFDAKHWIPDRETGGVLRKWLDGGVVAEPPRNGRDWKSEIAALKSEEEIVEWWYITAQHRKALTESDKIAVRDMVAERRSGFRKSGEPDDLNGRLQARVVGS